MEREGRVDAEMFAAGKDLRLVQWLGSQTWNIDLEAAKRAGVSVCFLPIMSCIHVAEHIVMQTFMLLRHATELVKIIGERSENEKEPALCDEDRFEINWKGFRKVQALGDKKFGILGFGEIGVEVARRMKGFGCQLYYNKRSPLPAHVESELGIVYATAENLTRECDIVCSLLPMNSDTAQSLSFDFFAKMEPGAYFITCGGSGTVNEDALIQAIRFGHLGGAALDNFTWEPIKLTNPLLELLSDPANNVILTPHVAAGTERTNRANDFANISRLLSGEPLLNQIG